jgi:UDP-glucose 4-epimerase
VVELLAHKGNDILVLDDLSTGNVAWISDLIQHKTRVHFDLCDIRNKEHLRCALMAFQPEAICHLAAQPAISTSWMFPAQSAEINEIGTLNLIDSAKEFGARRIIFASTSAVYHESLHIPLHEYSTCEPHNPYGISKLAAEQYLRALFQTCLILRLGNVYGPRQFPVGHNQVVPLMFQHFLQYKQFYITGDGKQRRDFVFVSDVAEAFLAALYGDPGTYNIASGHQTSVNELAALLEGLYGAQGYPWDRTKENDPRQEVNLDVSEAKVKLGWRAEHSLKDGLAITADWWNNRQ